jgi:hypothetical protein
MDKPKSDIEGGCYCGAVRYRLSAEPLGSMICHCRTCRRISGAPVVAWITVEETRFSFTKGEPARFSSSAPVERTYCAACGTPLTYRSESGAGEIDVTTCTLDDSGRFPPTHHSWLSHNVGWVRFGDGLPSYPKSRSDGA